MLSPTTGYAFVSATEPVAFNTDGNLNGQAVIASMGWGVAGNRSIAAQVEPVAR